MGGGEELERFRGGVARFAGAPLCRGGWRVQQGKEIICARVLEGRMSPTEVGHPWREVERRTEGGDAAVQLGGGDDDARAVIRRSGRREERFEDRDEEVLRYSSDASERASVRRAKEACASKRRDAQRALTTAS